MKKVKVNNVGIFSLFIFIIIGIIILFVYFIFKFINIDNNMMLLLEVFIMMMN